MSIRILGKLQEGLVLAELDDTPYFVDLSSGFATEISLMAARACQNSGKLVYAERNDRKKADKILLDPRKLIGLDNDKKEV